MSVQPQSKAEAKPELTRQQRSEIAQKFRKELNKTKSNQGLLGKGWNWFKNQTGIGAGSDKTEAIISKFEQGQASVEEVQNSLKSFSEGQSMFVDVFSFHYHWAH